MSVDTYLLYIVHGPIMAALLVRILFAINSLIIILEVMLMLQRIYANFANSTESINF